MQPRHPRPLTITLLLAALLLLPSMASIGMFMDGTIYAAISRNLAEGVGSMWAPHFSAGLFPVFHEHPPLVFWLQSLFFRLLGDSWLTERAYDLCVMLAAAGLMRVLWLRITLERGLVGIAAYWWLPLLLWVVVPKWSWAYRNNVLENTMTVFCLLSVLLVLGALRASNARNAVLIAIAAAGTALLAFLAKGPVGLFVLASPVLLVPVLKHVDWRRMVVLAVVPAGFAALLGLLLAWPEARKMLTAYWHNQVIGRAGVSDDDISMLFELAKKIAPMLLVLAGFRLWLRRDSISGWWKPVRGPAIAMLAIALSASLPLLLGDLDSAHYLMPALPFFALGFGVVGASMLHGAGGRVRAALTGRPGRMFLLVSVIAATAIVVVSAGRLGEVRKNEDYHAFLEQVAQAAGVGTASGEGGALRIDAALDSALLEDWYLHAIAQRHYRISLVSDPVDAQWRLAPASKPPPLGYATTEITNRNWVLQRRKAVVPTQGYSEVP